MSEWKPQVVEAFQTLNLDINVATLEQAAKAYKTQAIRHHPDKNPGDPAATQRFQKLGAAWATCQTHFEDPESSYATAPDGPEIDLDDFELFMFLFQEAILERYRTRRNYRGSRRGGQGPEVLTPFGTFGFSSPSPSYNYGDYSYPRGGYSGNRQLKQPDDYNERTQAKDNADYEARLREFEKEIQEEERELRRQAMEKSKDERRRSAAYQQAFHAARVGNASLVMSLVKEYDLDVNGPEKMPKATEKTPKVTSKRGEKPTNHPTLLHAACRACDEGLITFLLDRGAIPDALNDAKLTPFHVAVSYGNVAAVKFFLLRRIHGKQTPGCHPSKAAPDGRTPLEIAIASRNAEMITIMTQQATVHDVERCWVHPDATAFRDILLEKKGFVDPETRELRRREEERNAEEERAREKQRAADKKARLAEKARLKEERQKRAAELRAQAEQKKREEAELAREKREAEERKAELERIAVETRCREEQEAAEAQRRAEHQAAEAAEVRRKAEKEAAAARRRAQQEAVEARRREEQEAAEAQRRAEQQAAEAAKARRKAEQEAAEARRRAEQEAAEARRRAEEAEATEARVRAEAQARQLAEEQERRRQAEKESRLRKAAKAEAAAEVSRQTAVQAQENTRAPQEAERNRREVLELQRVERKRAETLRRLQGQAEEHRRLAEARAHASKPQTVDAPQRPKLETPNTVQTEATAAPTEPRRKVSKKNQNRDISQLSPEELQKRAAQSARDKARIAEAKRVKMLETSTQVRADTPEILHRGEDYVPPTPVSMPSPTQRRLSPPLVPRHTRPNVPARKMDSLGVVILGPEDIQTGAIADDLFAVERPVGRPVVESGPPPVFRGRGRGGYRGRGRGRGYGRGIE